MATMEKQNVQERIKELENRLAEAEQLIEAIKNGEVDAFAVKNGGENAEVFTLHSGDYLYRTLVETINQGTLNITMDGLIVYVNPYFCESLGVSYEKVIGQYVFNFIHPDCDEKFEHLFTKAQTGTSKGEMILRWKENDLPVYVSLTSLRPKLDTIGMIITDLSEIKKHEKEMVQKTTELERSNAELAAFSYVASHDMNEPLRKIQSFCSLLREREFDRLSKTGQDYVVRMTSSVRRMQDLLDALLNYSRTNAGNNYRKLTDLNLILEEVKDNLRETIAENSAKIESTGLPKIRVIPYQMTQLFLNIIVNAIKYRRADVKPVIRVSSELVKAESIKGAKPMPRGQYWKIEFNDNGIGFENQYANKIFELFQRLHGRGEYEGTGLGLAICKKIVQNHDGYIEAAGVPNAGATFTVYLPANPVVQA